MTNHVNSCPLDEKTKSESGDGSTWLGIYSRYPLCCAASLLWPHFPINPQAPMKIMTKRATMHPKQLWDFTVRVSHDLQALKHKCHHARMNNVHTSLTNQKRTFCSPALGVTEHTLPMRHMLCWIGASDKWTGSMLIWTMVAIRWWGCSQMLTDPLNWAKMSIQIKFPGWGDNNSVQFCGTTAWRVLVYKQVSACIGEYHIKEGRRF